MHLYLGKNIHYMSCWDLLLCVDRVHLLNWLNILFCYHDKSAGRALRLINVCVLLHSVMQLASGPGSLTMPTPVHGRLGTEKLTGKWPWKTRTIDIRVKNQEAQAKEGLKFSGTKHLSRFNFYFYLFLFYLFCLAWIMNICWRLNHLMRFFQLWTIRNREWLLQ